MGKCPNCDEVLFVKLYCDTCLLEAQTLADGKLEIFHTVRPLFDLKSLIQENWFRLRSFFIPVLWWEVRYVGGREYLFWKPNLRNPFWFLNNLMVLLLKLTIGCVHLAILFGLLYIAYIFT